MTSRPTNGRRPECHQIHRTTNGWIHHRCWTCIQGQICHKVHCSECYQCARSEGCLQGSICACEHVCSIAGDLLNSAKIFAPHKCNDHLMSTHNHLYQISTLFANLLSHYLCAVCCLRCVSTQIHFQDTLPVEIDRRSVIWAFLGSCGALARFLSVH
jgi:hypothetical protein